MPPAECSDWGRIATAINIAIATTYCRMLKSLNGVAFMPELSESQTILEVAL